MTNRVLTPDEVQEIISRRRSIPDDVADLIDSHRLQAARIQELEETVGWYEKRHPND